MSESSLRAHRDFQLLWVGGFLAALGGQIATLALPLLILAETGSTALAGLVGSVAMAMLVITMIPGGAVADSVERYRLMLCCEVGSALTAIGLAVAVATGRPVLPVVLVATVVVSVLGCVYGPAATVLLRAAVPGDLLPAAMSRLRARSATARLVGPLLGGLLFARSHALPFVVEAVGLVASVGCLLAVRTRAVPPPRDPAESRTRHLLGGLSFVWRERYLRTVLMIFGFGVNAGFGGVMFAVVAVSGRADPSGRSTGFISACAAVGSLLGALSASRMRADRWPRAMILVTCWTCAGCGVLLTVTPRLWYGVVIGVVLAVAAVGSVAFSTIMAVRTPPQTQGRVEAAGGFVSMVAQPVGPFASGLLLQRLDPVSTFAIFALAFLTCAVAATLAGGLRVAQPVAAGPTTVPPPAPAGRQVFRAGRHRAGRHRAGRHRAGCARRERVRFGSDTDADKSGGVSPISPTPRAGMVDTMHGTDLRARRTAHR